MARRIGGGQGADNSVYRLATNGLTFSRHYLAVYRKIASRLAATMSEMANNLRHFSINADDIARARQFYEKVFGWKFQPWGPPDFFLIQTGNEKDPGIQGSLQGRRELVKGQRMTGFECTVSVEDVDAIAKAVEANGGKVIMPKVTIPTVGRLIFFQDPEGNVAGAMHYDADAE